MYDRKTWIILALCGVLIALNIHFSAKKGALTEANNPKAPETEIQEIDAENSPGLSVETQPPPTNEELIVLENDKVIFTLSTIGGGIKYAELKDQKNVGDATKVRINRHGSGPIAGFVNSNETLDTSSYAYKADLSTPGKTAVFIAKLPSGIIVKKTFSLETKDIPGRDYFLDLNLALENTNPGNFDLSQYGLFLGAAGPLYEKERSTYTGFFWYSKGSMNFKDPGKFKGGMLSTEKFIITSTGKDGENEDIIYAGVTDQFFTTVIRPAKPANTPVWGKPQKVTLKKGGKTLSAIRGAMALPAVSLASGSPITLDYRIFTGPKANTLLRKLDNAKDQGNGWGDMMQYGFFSPVSRTLNAILNWLHGGLSKISKHESWGLAIICLTLIVRTCIWPLHAKSTRSMKRMSKLQPKMAEMKEKYKDDPNKLNTEMMGMYRKYGINPLGGCLPMFIQIPIFFGFFRMLDYAVELRNQPFLWVADLSQPDTLTHISGIPINILPIVMAITSAIQMAMMPKTGDKMQQRIMMFMPLTFFFFCYNYASALALYWTTQNIFSIGQTYLMNKIPEPELVARKDGGKKSWVQRMAEKQAAMQKGQKSGTAGNMRNVTPEKPKKKGPPRTGG